MGTSSSRRGKVTQQSENEILNEISWQSAKTTATRFFNGTGSFGMAMQKVILAAGGKNKFASAKRVKKAKAFGILLNFFNVARNSSIRDALTKSGIQVDDEKPIQDQIIEYINSVVYPDAISYSDTENREELTSFALQYYELFDSGVMQSEEERVILNALSEIVCDGLVLEIMNSFEGSVPQSLENENIETTIKQMTIAKADVKSKVQKYSKMVSLKSDLKEDVEEYANTIYDAVIDEYLSEDFDDE